MFHKNKCIKGSAHVENENKSPKSNFEDVERCFYAEIVEGNFYNVLLVCDYFSLWSDVWVFSLF